MVRHVKTTGSPATPGWKALLAVTVAAGALLWHVLACVESPMAFSPGGKDLAFVASSNATLEDKDIHLAGTRTFRLMVLHEAQRVRLVEETDKHLLTAPGYSPDGQQLCYFRVPLLTAEQADAAKKAATERLERLRAAVAQTQPAGVPNWVGKTFGEALTSWPAEGEDKPTERMQQAAEFWGASTLNPPVPVELVVRDAKALDIVLATATVSLPIYDFTSGQPGGGLTMTYALDRPRYSPDGKWVYASLGNVTFRVDPKTGKAQLLAAPSMLGRLSPDGKTLAVWTGRLTFLDLEGDRETSAPLSKDFSPAGFFWTGNDALGVLRGKDKHYEVALFDASGKLVRTVPLGEAEVETAMPGELAIAPDGKRMVVATGKETLFFDGSGKLLRRVEEKDAPLTQPTFTPDGKRVAFKRLNEAKDGDKQRIFATAIVFYSPEGKELSSVQLPPFEAKANDKPK